MGRGHSAARAAQDYDDAEAGTKVRTDVFVGAGYEFDQTIHYGGVGGDDSGDGDEGADVNADDADDSDDRDDRDDRDDHDDVDDMTVNYIADGFDHLSASPVAPASPAAPAPADGALAATRWATPPHIRPWRSWTADRSAYCATYKPRSGEDMRWWDVEAAAARGFFAGSRGKLRQLPPELLKHYLTPSDVLALYGMLRDVTAVFHRHCVPYWLHSATLLGAVRHGGLIPWDEDIDLAMFGRDVSTLMGPVRSDLNRLGYDVMLFTSLYRHRASHFQIYRLGPVGALNRGCKGQPAIPVAPWPFLDVWPMRYHRLDADGSGGHASYESALSPKPAALGARIAMGSGDALTHQSPGVASMFNLEIFPLHHVLPLRPLRFGPLTVLAPGKPLAYLNDCGSYRGWRKEAFTASSSFRARGATVTRYHLDLTDPELAASLLPGLPFGPLPPLPSMPPAQGGTAGNGRRVEAHPRLNSKQQETGSCAADAAWGRGLDLSSWTGVGAGLLPFSDSSLAGVSNRINVLAE